VTPSCAVISCSSLSLMTVLPNEQNGIITNKHKMTNEVKTFFHVALLKILKLVFLQQLPLKITCSKINFC
jgi:hypothetical protein